jgi:hypothetical protein
MMIMALVITGPSQSRSNDHYDRRVIKDFLKMDDSIKIISELEPSKRRHGHPEAVMPG